MPPSAYLPPPPDAPVSQLPRAQIRSLAHAYGHHKRHAAYRFSALLPIVVKDKIYQDDGCLDEYEWASKYGAFSHAEVDRVMALWKTIGEYDCLWRLLAEGVGMTKLERVAPHVTPDNAEGLAKKVVALTKPEIEEYLRSIRKPSPVSRPGAVTFSVRDGAPGPSPDCLTSAEPAPAESARTKSRLSIEVDALGEKRIRDLQDMYERLHGRPIGIGQLVSLLAHWATLRGELPSIEDLAEGVLAEREAGKAEERPAATVPVRRFKPRLLEVVVSIAETGWKFVRTALGWVPVCEGALAGFLSPGQPIPLENLRIAAIAAARDVTGSRYRPAPVERYLIARSGGYCEVQDCSRRGAAAHHRNRFAYDPSHHPDDLVCVCTIHHGLVHARMVRNEADDPAAWELLRVGEAPELEPIDLKFSAARAPLTY